MKNIIVLILTVVSFNIYAGDHCSSDSASQEIVEKTTLDNVTEHEESVKECSQKVRVVTKYVTKWKTKVVYKDRVVKSKPKIIYRDRIVYKDKPAKIKWKTKKVVKKKKYVRYPNKNSISLLGFAQRTKVTVDEDPTEYEVDREHEFDWGLMYQRDFSRDFRFSVGGNTDGTGFVGLGYNF